jgi:hypothetical protein
MLSYFYEFVLYICSTTFLFLIAFCLFSLYIIWWLLMLDSVPVCECLSFLCLYLFVRLW